LADDPSNDPVFVLPAPQITQEQPQWCWAAVTEIMLSSFSKWQSLVPQCVQASTVFGQKCCDTPDTCNGRDWPCFPRHNTSVTVRNDCWPSWTQIGQNLRHTKTPFSFVEYSDFNSADRNHVELFRLYGASGWQTLRYLRLPSALPYFLAGLRISGGLALIGAVVAEFVAGTGGSGAGLAYQILLAGFQLNIPRLFAALLLITASGVALFGVTIWVSRLALARWHESEHVPVD